MVRKYVPERGDIVSLSLDPVRGREQAGHRPALVLSSSSYHEKSSLVFICPITSKKKGYPFEVEIFGGKISGVALVDQSRSLDWRERKARFLERIAPSLLREIQIRLLSLITR